MISLNSPIPPLPLSLCPTSALNTGEVAVVYDKNDGRSIARTLPKMPGDSSASESMMGSGGAKGSFRSREWRARMVGPGGPVGP